MIWMAKRVNSRKNPSSYMPSRFVGLRKSSVSVRVAGRRRPVLKETKKISYEKQEKCRISCAWGSKGGGRDQIRTVRRRLEYLSPQATHVNYIRPSTL